MTPYIVALHIIVMFAATALAQGPAFMLYRALRREDVAGIRAILDQYGSLGRFIGPTYGLGIIIGLIAVFVGEFDPFEPWLIIAYVLTVIAVATPRLLLVPRLMRLGKAAAASPVDAPSPELRAEIARASNPIIWLDAAIVVLFIIDMVVKPFS